MIAHMRLTLVACSFATLAFNVETPAAFAVAMASSAFFVRTEAAHFELATKSALLASSVQAYNNTTMRGINEDSDWIRDFL